MSSTRRFFFLEWLVDGKNNRVQLLCFLVVFPFCNSQQSPYEVSAVITHFLAFSKVFVAFFMLLKWQCFNLVEQLF